MININTAIILFTHRRPLHTYKILKILKLINLKKIYIVSDGWRNNEEKKQVLIVRDLVIKNNYSFKVNKFFLDRNIGVRNIFKIGLDWVFKYEKKIIVLEDDTVPNNSFFKFCDTLLIKYKNNKKISMICGTNFKSSLTQKNADSYFFSKYTFIWGWATWKDRWSLYDNKLKKWDKFKKNKSINKHFSNTNEIKFWKKNLEYLKKNPNKGAWDFPLTFANFYHKKISIVPKVNLITNIGYDDPSGHNPKKNSNLKKINIKFPLEHPKKLETSNEYDNYCSKKVFSIPSFRSRILNKIKKYLNY
jgi:hypothetical protein